MTKHILNKIVFNSMVVLSGALLTQCSTKKNTAVNRTFHNITAHFNAYFHGNESFKEGVLKLEELQKDNYTDILPVFKFGNKEVSVNIYPQMDRAIEKATKVIEHHEIQAKSKKEKGKRKKKKAKREKEKSTKKKDGTYKNWIDDSFLLIGKANFYKLDYVNAIKSFDYVVKKYSKYPIKYSALIWLIKSHIEQDEFTEAQAMLDLMEDKKNKKDMPAKLEGDLQAAHAYFYMKQKAYGPAIPKLKKAIKATNKKKIKARYTYILAQIYEQQGDISNAAKYYSEVLDMNPSYEMAFNAEINRAKTAGLSSKNSKETKKQFEKMLRDEKNKDYLDQIYYTLAMIALREGDMNSAIEYLKLSAASSIANNPQKGIAFLRLADIYFARPEFSLAKAYYDSAAASLTASFPDYAKLINKQNSLKDIVKFINIIAFEDSVQRLAKMSPDERNAVIDKQIEQVIEKEKAAKQQPSPKGGVQYSTGRDVPKSVSSGSMWYFYNPAAVSFGYNEFKKKWGDRKPEDNWRRENKNSLSLEAPEIANDTLFADNNDDLSLPVITNSKDKNEYFKNIPLTQPQMQASHNRIAEALYNLGIVYKELLMDNEQSAKTFEELLKRYPNSKYKLSACYQLYRLYLSKGNYSEAEKYKDIILREYPDSDYAMLLLNPGYMQELETAKKQEELYYEQTYYTYSQKQYSLVIERCENALALYPDGKLKPKFHYLKALATGRTSDVETFRQTLQDIIKIYSNDPVKEEAQMMLDYITVLQNK